jgi:hypothetical protein
MPPRLPFQHVIRSTPRSLSLSTPTSRLIHTPSRPCLSQSLSLRNARESSKRTISIPSKPFAQNHPYLTFGIRLSMSAVLGVGLVIGVILGHDAFTYSDKHVDRVPINPLAIHPRRGGKKNLPIIEVNLDAEEAEKQGMKNKPRLVIVGGGWGVGLLVYVTLIRS